MMDSVCFGFNFGGSYGILDRSRVIWRRNGGYTRRGVEGVEVGMSAVREFGTGRVLRLSPVEEAERVRDDVVLRLFACCEGCGTGFRVPSRDAVLDRRIQCGQCGREWVCAGGDIRGEELVPEVVPHGMERVRERESHSEVVVNEDKHEKGLKCTHFKQCPGCSLEGPAVAEPDKGSRLMALVIRTLGYKRSVNIVLGPVKGWRTLAKLAVRPQKLGRGPRGYPVIGLFKEKSHDIVAVPECQVHHPSINVCTKVVQQELRPCGITAYDDLNGDGMLRYVQVMVERATGLCQLTLVWNASSFKEIGAQAHLLGKVLWNRRDVALLHSVWFSLNTSSGNVILTSERSKWKLIRGNYSVKEQFCGITAYFPPFSFRQANLSLFERIVERLADFVDQNSNVLEICGGVGLIGLSLLSKKQLLSLVVTDMNASSEDGFTRSRDSLEPSLRPRARFLAASMDSAASSLHNVDTVIIDPPRSGISDALLQYLIKTSFKNRLRLMYLSCGLESFEKDARRLVTAGWKTTFVEGFLLFPGTQHVETLAVFDRT